MGAKKEPYISTPKSDIKRFDGELGLLMWYSILKDYYRRLRHDKNGFVRVSSKIFKEDINADRMKVWRYNKKLEDKGLIVVDRVARGRKTWIGFKII